MERRGGLVVVVWGTRNVPHSAGPTEQCAACPGGHRLVGAAMKLC